MEEEESAEGLRGSFQKETERRWERSLGVKLARRGSWQGGGEGRWEEKKTEGGRVGVGG